MNRSPRSRSDAASTRAERGSVSALLIGHDPSLCRRLREIFEPKRFHFARLEHESECEVALELIDSEQFDLVFVDPVLLRHLMQLRDEMRTAKPLPPLIAVTLETKLEKLPGIAGRIALDTLTPETAPALDRLKRDYAAWNRLIEHHRAFESLIASIATRFIQLPSSEMDAAITDALARSAVFAEVDRAYLFLISDDRKSVTMTHEWCREGVQPAAGFYARQSLAPVRWLYQHLASGEALAVNDLRDLPSEERGLQQIIGARGVTSFALVPLLYGGTLLGALGFSRIHQPKRWSADTTALLRILGEVLVNAVQRRRTEEAFQASETRFRTLVESLGEGILLCDTDDTILHVNSRMSELMRFTPEEMIGQRAYELLLPRDESYKIRERTLQRLQGISEAYTIRLRRKDESCFWAEINAAPIRGNDGEVVGTVSAVTDISDRKIALEALQTSETKYRDLVETSSDLIWSCDKGGNWSFVNQAAERIYGYKPEEMLGHQFTEVVSPAYAARARETFKRLLAGESVFQHETEHLRRDGTAMQLSFNAIALRDKAGRIIGATGTASDISWRKRAEAALSKSEERFKRYFDLPLIGMGVSNADNKWLDVNQRFCEMLGYTREELVGRGWKEFTHPDDLSPNLAEIKQALDQNIDQWSYEKRYVRKDGSVLYVATSAACIRKADGSVDYYLALHQDITERKRAEETSRLLQRQLLQSQKMEAIGQLAAGIAHDLNNALAAVVGHLQLLRMGESGPERDKQSIDTALSGCTRASSLIEQLLGFSQQGKYNVAPVSLQRIVHETIDFLSKVVGTNIKIEIDAAGQDLIVRGDASQIQQALTNLILNAQQAMDSGGTITFRFGTKRRSHPERFNPVARAGRYAFLAVEDTGIGITPENLDKVFEPFFTTKSRSRGTGLGLSTVYGIMQSHGGWVEVESVPGRGSVFSLYFPESRGAILEVLQPQRVRESDDKSGAVMVIDDEKVLVDLGQEFLRRAGLRAFGFTDAEEALRWYQAHSSEIDVIILDMKMPGTDGQICFAELRRINPHAQIAILSGYSQDAAAHELLKRGALKFFQKPLKYPDLVQWIKELLAQQGRSAPHVSALNR